MRRGDFGRTANEWHWNLESSSGKNNPHGNGQISTSPKHRSNLPFGWLFNIFHRQQLDVRENHGIQHLNPSNIIYKSISSMKLKAQFGLKQRWRRSQLFARVCEIALVAHVATLGMPVFAHLREFQGVSGLLCRHLTKEKVQQLWCVLSQILHYRHFDRHFDRWLPYCPTKAWDFPRYYRIGYIHYKYNYIFINK